MSLLITNVLLAILIFVGLLNVLGLHLNRKKVDEAVRQVLATRDKIVQHCEEHDAQCKEFARRDDALRGYLNGFAGWLSLQRAIHDAATTALKDKD